MYHPYRSIPPTGKLEPVQAKISDNMSDVPDYLVEDGEPVPESAPTKINDDMKPTLESPSEIEKKLEDPADEVTEETNPQESTPKKKHVRHESRTIKSNPCDLKVIISGEDGEQTERWYQSATMAEHSIFVDSKIEEFIAEGASKPFEISFKDIDETTWDLMMKFLDPVESRDMLAKDVLIVSEYYDHYDFPQGRKLCDKVLKEYFESERSNESDMDVEMLVDAVAVAYKAHLLEAYTVGNRFVKDKVLAYKEKMYSYHKQADVYSIPEYDLSDVRSETRSEIKSEAKSEVSTPSKREKKGHSLTGVFRR